MHRGTSPFILASGKTLSSAFWFLAEAFLDLVDALDAGMKLTLQLRPMTSVLPRHDPSDCHIETAPIQKDIIAFTGRALFLWREEG